jgi:RecA-family ATPase
MMTDKLAPTADRLAYISKDLSLAPPGAKMSMFVDRVSVVGDLVRGGFLNAETAESKLWDIARAHKLTGEPGSGSEEFIDNIIGKAVALTVEDEPRANGHDADRTWSPPTSQDDYGGADTDRNREPPRDGEQEQKPLIIEPFETFDASQWEGVPIEDRRWIVHNRIPVGEPGIMSGDGGTGKTKLALQLGAAVSAELPDWVGGVVETHGPVIVFSAEEKLKEMHRRMRDVLEHRTLSFKDLRGRLHFICDHHDPVLGAVDRNGIVQPTMSLLRLEKTVIAIRPALVVVENAADVYSGNESDRPNVTRFVRSLLGRLTASCESTVMLIQHPSVSGLNDGTGRSGSTGWNNAGRWRNNFTTIKDDDDGLRQLEIVKNNYGPKGEKVRLRWERGVFVPEGSVSAPRQATTQNKVDRLFIQLLEERNEQGRWVTPNKAAGYAPKELAAMTGAEGTTPEAFAKAMERLLKANRIIVQTVGSPSKQRQRLIVVPTFTNKEKSDEPT